MTTVLSRVFVFAIVAWAGFLVMALELLSGRILAPNFGYSIYVWGAVITVFMLALATGYFVGGRLSLRAPSLAKLAGILLAAAVATLPVVSVGDAVLDWLFDRVQDPRWGALLATTLLFFVPTALAGMVTPYSVRLLVADPQRSGQYAGLLYFVSTFGSAVGTLLTSFYLVLYLEVNHIVWGLLAISVVLGLVPLARAPHA